MMGKIEKTLLRVIRRKVLKCQRLSRVYVDSASARQFMQSF